MRKKQCLKVPPVTGFRALKMGIFISKMNNTLVGQLGSMKSEWINIFAKIHVKRQENWRSRWIVIKEKQLWWITYNQWEKVRKSAPGGATHFERNQQKSVFHNRCQFTRSASLNAWSQTTFSLLYCRWRWEMVPLRQYEAAKRMDQPRQTSDSVSKARPLSPKGHVMCKVELEKHNSLRTGWAQPNIQCGALRWTISPIQQFNNSAIQEKGPYKRNGVLLQQQQRPSSAQQYDQSHDSNGKCYLILPYSPDLVPSDFYLFRMLCVVYRSVMM